MALELNIIVAVGNKTENGYPIGRNGMMPWRCKEDLQWFKEVTMGYPVIMGRKTFESIGKILPGRKNIVITSQLIPVVNDNLIYVKNVEEAIEIASKLSEKAFIIGGGSVYKYAIENDLVDNIYIDELNLNIDDADTFFPDFKNRGSWNQVGRRVEVAREFAYASVYEKERGRRNNEVDSQYLNLIKDILENGTEKNTRAGKTISVFGRQMRFNLKKGLPMLTTKKMFSKGVIHELLWFLKGDTNIKYLVDNNVHIWDDDAYRFFLEYIEKLGENYSGYKNITKEDFIQYVLNDEVIRDYTTPEIIYKFGDLGPVYGKQWRNWNGIDQIQDVIHKLKTNPDDRRLIVSAWNVSDIPGMALPPCHYCCQFYSTEMTLQERRKWYWNHVTPIGSQNVDIETMDEANVPKRKLSCMWNQRSVDCFLGLPFNIESYSILTYIIAHCVNMDVDELIFIGGDVHIYLNQMDAINEQLKRNPYKYDLPHLKLNPDIKNIEYFKYEDIKIIGYESYPAIKAPLSVGL